MAPTIYTELQRKQTIQDTIDRLLYTPGYSLALKQLNEQFKVNSKIESNGIRKFQNVTIAQ